ncbi:LAFA_0B07184g1_1 [Lachancea sp. 'fantastica']|nr:LAFA_0B07184g1_1 [Lachancea sp. 'fantastica']
MSVMLNLFNFIDFGFYTTFLVGILSLLLAKIRAPLLLKYGKTLPEDAKNGQDKSLWALFQQLTVPKGWFSHFYVYSGILSCVNLIALRLNILSVLMAVHSLRRLYETTHVNKSKPSARIHVSHYMVGFWYYSAVNYAIYRSKPETWSPPLIKSFAILMFILASWDQYKNHLYLSQLRKYTLPTKGLFRLVASAHYLDEICLYSAMTLYSRSTKLLVCLLWVISSLSVSAIETRKWYSQKFPQSTPKFAILPYIL